MLLNYEVCISLSSCVVIIRIWENIANIDKCFVILLTKNIIIQDGPSSLPIMANKIQVETSKEMKWFLNKSINTIK